MEAIYSNIADFILHFDRYLPVVMEAYGHWIYAFLFIIVFCETGLVVTPFLPGDSLLFACGALAASIRFCLPAARWRHLPKGSACRFWPLFSLWLQSPAMPATTR